MLQIMTKNRLIDQQMHLKSKIRSIKNYNIFTIPLKNSLNSKISL